MRRSVGLGRSSNFKSPFKSTIAPAEEKEETPEAKPKTTAQPTPTKVETKTPEKIVPAPAPKKTETQTPKRERAQEVLPPPKKLKVDPAATTGVYWAVFWCKFTNKKHKTYNDGNPFNFGSHSPN